MERDFWLERWAKGQIGFHQRRVSPLLESYWPRLGVKRDAIVFVPLCGKSLDMRYLESVGHRVIGVEYSAAAIEAYFAERGESWSVEHDFYLDRYCGTRSTIYCGDFFDLHAPDVMGTRAVYDRGALVALPAPLRSRYADHLQRILPERSLVLLVALEYDQSRVPGPPFAVMEAEIRELYHERMQVELLDRLVTGDLPPRFGEAGIAEVGETVYRLAKLR